MVALGNVGLHLALALSWMLLLEAVLGILPCYKVEVRKLISDRLPDRERESRGSFQGWNPTEGSWNCKMCYGLADFRLKQVPKIAIERC